MLGSGCAAWICSIGCFPGSGCYSILTLHQLSFSLTSPKFIMSPIPLFQPQGCPFQRVLRVCSPQSAAT